MPEHLNEAEDNITVQVMECNEGQVQHKISLSAIWGRLHKNITALTKYSAQNRPNMSKNESNSLCVKDCLG